MSKSADPKLFPSLLSSDESNDFGGDIEKEIIFKRICDYVDKNKRREFISLSMEMPRKEMSLFLITPLSKVKLRMENPGKHPTNVVAKENPENCWWTLLHLMASLNRVEMLTSVEPSIQEILVNISGSTEHWADAFGQTPLHVAIIKGHVAVCRMLCRQAVNAKSARAKNALVKSPNILDVQDKIGCTALHYTVFCPSRSLADELTKLLLTSGADPNITDIDGFTPLAMAAARGNIEQCSFLLANGSNPNFQSPDDGWTPLMLACYHGNTKLVVGLLNPLMLPKINEYLPVNMAPTPAHPGLQNQQKATALIIASQFGHCELIEEMFPASKLVPVTINHRDIAGRTALACAAFKGHTDVVALLLQMKANPDICDDEGCSPLMLAIYKGNRAIVELLLQHGADISLSDINGCTAIMVAVSSGNADVLKLVLNVAHNLPNTTEIVNAQQENGTTALLLAVVKGNEKIVEMLMASHASLEFHRPIDEWTAIFHAVYVEKVKALKAMMVRQMSQIGVHSPASLLTNRVLVEVNRHITTQRITPLIIACLTGNSHTAKVLLENGANANDCDATGLTPLMAAAQSGSDKLVHLLLARGAEANRQEVNGYNALMIAAFLGHAKICDQLLASKANPDLTQINGRTALMFAAEMRHFDVVRVLLKRHCDVTITDILHRNAVHYAILGADEQIMTMLCEVENIEPNVQDKDGVTPLMLAASNPLEVEEQPEPIGNRLTPASAARKSTGRSSRNVKQKQPGGPPVEILHVVPLIRMKGKIEFDLVDTNGDTALMRSYRAQNWTLAEALLRAGASPTIISTNDGLCPGALAALKGHTQGVKLIKHLAKTAVDFSDIWGRTPLFHAVEKDQTEIVALLLSMPAPSNCNKPPLKVKNSEIERQWFHGMAPLHIAAKYGFLEIAKLLIKHGADVDRLNDRRETPLMMAANECNWDIVELLLTNDANIIRRDTVGQTVFQRLCYITDEYEACRGFRIFVKHRGAAVLDKVVDKPHGNTALHWAVTCDRSDIVDELIILGASTDVRNNNGKIPSELVVYAPTLFESFGEIIGSDWLKFIKILAAIGNRRDHFTDEKLQDIAESFDKNDEKYNEKCAAMSIEKFYESKLDTNAMDVESIEKAWRVMCNLKDSENIPYVLLFVLEHCKGKTLVFKAATLDCLTKERTSPRRMSRSEKSFTT